MWILRWLQGQEGPEIFVFLPWHSLLFWVCMNRSLVKGSGRLPKKKMIFEPGRKNTIIFH